jgi:hypothetical protein
VEEMMIEEEIERTVDAWIVAFSSEKDSSEYEESRWATDRLLDWTFDGDSESLWRFVKVAYRREIPDDVFSVLAAGPMEDLLAEYGPAYIDRVEDLARRDPKFNALLGGVWKNSMTDEVWQRVQAIRNEVW